MGYAGLMLSPVKGIHKAVLCCLKIYSVDVLTFVVISFM
jgi:hypothetical protein